MGLSLLVLFAQVRYRLVKLPLSLHTSPSVFPSLSSLSTPDWKVCGMNWKGSNGSVCDSVEDLPLRHITAGTARYRGRRSDRLYAIYRRLYYQLLCGRPQFYYVPLYIYAMVKRGISPEINALSTLLMLQRSRWS